MPAKREYTDADKKAAYRMYIKKKWGYLRISKIIGCSASTVRKWIKAQGFETRPSSKYPEDKRQEVIRDYILRTEDSIAAVASDHHVDPKTLSRWLYDSGITPRDGHAVTIDREAILEDLKDGSLTKAQIASKNKCSERWVYAIQSGDV